MSPLNESASSTSAGTPTATGSASGTVSASATGSGKSSDAGGSRVYVYGVLSSVVAVGVAGLLSF